MADNLLSSFLPDDRASFGIFPQMKPRRRFQDPVGAANVPLDVTRGRVAGLAGLLPDALNFMGRSPMPTEQFGETQYEPAQQLPYGSEYFLQNLPLKPTSRIGEVAGQAGAFVPLNPMPAARAVAAGARALGPTAVRMAEGYLQRQGLMPGVVPEAPVPPATPLASMIEKPQAPVSELGFYSATEQAALNLPRKSGTGESFLNDLMKGQDVKKDELSWMGLDDYLKGKPNVTRQEVQDFISNNRVDVRERQLGAAVAEDPVGMASRQAVFDKYEPEIQDLYRRIDKPEYVVYDPETNKVLKNYTNYDDALLDNLNPMGAFSKARTSLRPKENSRQLQAQLTDLQTARDAEANAAYVIPEPTPTRYQQYQLPGGENYREILLTLPKKPQPLPEGFNVDAYSVNGVTKYGVYDATGSRYASGLTKDQALQKFNELHGEKSYTSSHFNEPNILAHMRVNDRVDADGKKMLLIEEIQSDWHQAGREKGYNTPEKKAAEQEKLNSILTERQNLLEEQKRLEELALPYTSQGKDAPSQIVGRWSTVSNRLQNLQTEQNRLGRTTGEGVPDAPFKDTWHQLALKRALKYAADNGYDRVGLTTGRQQVDRYTNEMRQNVDEIQFQTGQKLTDSQANELQLLRNKARDEGLSKLNGTERQRYDNLLNNEGEYVGKNQTKIKAFKGSDSTFSGIVKDGKFIEGPAQGKTVEEVLGKSMAKKIAEQRTGTIKGDDLTIGGEGMKKYYDEIYPAFLAKQGKKYNAKTGETTIGLPPKTSNSWAYFRDWFAENHSNVGGGSTALANWERGANNSYVKEFEKFRKTATQNENIRYIDISPEMRGGVKKGQPLFTAAPIGGIGLGAGTQDKQQNSINSFIQ